MAFERTLFVPAQKETRVQRLQRERSIKRYHAELMFKRFDVDASGELDLNELGALLNELGMLLNAEDLGQVAAQIDTDQSGCVDIAEFVEWYVNLSDMPIAFGARSIDAFTSIACGAGMRLHASSGARCRSAVEWISRSYVQAFWTFGDEL